MRLSQFLKPIDHDSVKERMSNLKNKLSGYPTFSSETKNDEIKVLQPGEFKMPPLIAGTMNNWAYKPMVKIEEFLMMLDPDFVEPLEAMRLNEEILPT